MSPALAQMTLTADCPYVLLLTVARPNSGRAKVMMPGGLSGSSLLALEAGSASNRYPFERTADAGADVDLQRRANLHAVAWQEEMGSIEIGEHPAIDGFHLEVLDA
jgi:hypothetical protein